MPRTITTVINYAKLISTNASLDTATSQYTVGHYDATPLPNGGVTTETVVLTDHPELLQGTGSATTLVISTDTQGAILQRIIGLICAAEGLNPAQGDRIYNNDGTRVI